jgi:hypothetical protein
MDAFAVSHFSNQALIQDLKGLVAQDRRTTAVLLTRVAEVDDRRLYRGAGFPSMHAYCVHELHFSEGAAYKHINAARAARRFPALLIALAENRLHLRAILMLAPHLTSGNADELVAAATHKTRAEIELLLARRFPRPDLPERLQAVPAPPVSTLVAAPGRERVAELTPEQVAARIPDPPDHGHGEALPRPAPQPAPGRVEAPTPRPRMTALAPARFGLQVTIDQETYDLLQHVRALMSHEIPTGEIALVLKGALKLAAGQLEKRRFAATTRPGHARPGSSPRHIPAAVKRAVWERDGGRCTFVSDSGQRCPARKLLEFDHGDPVARGGEATLENLRLRCRAHNAYAAERTFGGEFMERKRAEAQRGGRGEGGVWRSRTRWLSAGP